MKKYLLVIIMAIELLQLVVSNFKTIFGQILFYLIWFLRPTASNLSVTKQVLNNRSQQAKYLAPQMQINPHFLDNTLERIRNETMVGQLNKNREKFAFKT